MPARLFYITSFPNGDMDNFADLQICIANGIPAFVTANIKSTPVKIILYKLS